MLQYPFCDQDRRVQHGYEHGVCLHISSNHSTLSKDDKINIIHLSERDMLKSPILSARAVGLGALALNSVGLVPHSWFFVSDLTCLKCLARQHSIYE